jgi:hypothetical protein
MPQSSTLRNAIRRAERILPGTAAPEGERDPRWQAIIRVGEFVETHPEDVWLFTLRWAKHAQQDLRMAVATCLLEHLLEHHFDLMFPRVREAAGKSVRFAETLSWCSEFGEASLPRNAARLQRLLQEVRRPQARKQ